MVEDEDAFRFVTEIPVEEGQTKKIPVAVSFENGNEKEARVR